MKIKPQCDKCIRYSHTGPTPKGWCSLLQLWVHPDSCCGKWQSAVTSNKPKTTCKAEAGAEK